MFTYFVSTMHNGLFIQQKLFGGWLVDAGLNNLISTLSMYATDNCIPSQAQINSIFLINYSYLSHVPKRT